MLLRTYNCMLFQQLQKTKARIPALRQSNGQVDTGWYDREYFEGTHKSNWGMVYDWENFGGVFEQWATFFTYGFPESRKFLDVGCGRGLLVRAGEELKAWSKLQFQIEGFDGSAFAIENCDPKAKPFVQCAALDDYTFDKDYDVMLCMDVFGHLTEAQACNWLLRSRKHIKDRGFFIIELNEPHQRAEPSHINLRSRRYWHKMFLRCGWRQDYETKYMQWLAAQDFFTNQSKVRMFIYQAN